MNVCLNNNFFAIPKTASTSGRNKKFFHTFLNDNHKLYIASVQPVNSTTTVFRNMFEIVITTTEKTFSAHFSCYAGYNSLNSIPSNYVSITTVTPLSSPTLISNVSHVTLHHPFTLTCSLPSQFNLNSRAYQVAFLSSRDGLIADYEVEGMTKQIKMLIINDKIKK